MNTLVTPAAVPVPTASKPRLSPLSISVYASLQFADHDFAGLSGVRVVRIATHPDFQGMGYGSQALQQLLEYYQGKTPSVGEGAPLVKPSGSGQQEQQVRHNSKLF